MRNILFDIIGNGMVNDEIVQAIKDNLLEKYQKSFEVLYLGKRFGTFTNDTVTAFCCPSDNQEIVFKCILNRDRIHFEDNYCLRAICYELEKVIKQEFEELKILAFLRINIVGKNKYDKIVPLKEFVDNEKNIDFLIKLFIKNEILDIDIEKVFNNIKEKYKNIKIRSINYMIYENYYTQVMDQIKDVPSLESFEVDETELIRKTEFVVENNLIRWE